MITHTQVILTASEAIEQSVDVANFCQAQYGKDLTIFVGLDTVNPPSESDAPFCILTPGLRGFDAGTFPAQRNPSFDVVWAVKDGGITTVGSVVTQDGFTKTDQLGQLILAALKEAFTDETGDHFGTAIYWLGGESPLWDGGISATLTYEEGMGED